MLTISLICSKIMQVTLYIDIFLFDFGSKSIQSFSEEMLGLERMVKRMILESLSLEKYIDEHMESNYYLLRLMKYRGPETTEAKLGLYGHKDKNIMTILYQNDVDGLEVRTKNGEWIQVKPCPNSFIVMIGDALYVSPFPITLLSNVYVE